MTPAEELRAAATKLRESTAAWTIVAGSEFVELLANWLDAAAVEIEDDHVNQNWAGLVFARAVLRTEGATS